MLSVDTETQQQWRREEKRENSQERRLRELVHDLESNTVTVEDDNGRDVTNLLAQIGKPMTSTQVMEKLKACNSRLHFVLAKTYNLWGIYLIKPGVNVNCEWNIDKDCVHICGMGNGVMPELSVRHKKKKKVPNKDLLNRKNVGREIDWVEVDTFADETRGWRTVLVRLLHAGLINRNQIEKHFGWNPTYESKRWADATKGY